MESLGAVIGIFSAIVGAVIGAWYTRRLGSPRPVVSVDQLEMTTSPTKWTGDVTIPNKALINAVDDNPFVETTLDFEGKVEERRMSETKYVAYLNNVLSDIDEVVNVWSSAREIAKGFREHLTTDDYDALEKTWSREQLMLWRLLSAACLRGDLVYSDNVPNYEGLYPVHEVKENEQEGEYLVPLSGNYTSLLFDAAGPPWSGNAHWDKDKLKPFAKRTAYAFAYRTRDDLTRIVRFLLNSMRYENALADLRALVEQEFELHHRLIVKGQVSNTGATPFSVANKAKIFVGTRNYPLTRIEPDGSKQQKRHPDDTEITVLLGTKDSAYESPVAIESGKVERFIAVSEKRIKDLPQEEVVRTTFASGERKYYMGILTILPGRRPLQPKYTASLFFRDWETKAEIPPK